MTTWYGEGNHLFKVILCQAICLLKIRKLISNHQHNVWTNMTCIFNILDNSIKRLYQMVLTLCVSQNLTTNLETVGAKNYMSKFCNLRKYLMTINQGYEQGTSPVSYLMTIYCLPAFMSVVLSVYSLFILAKSKYRFMPSDYNIFKWEILQNSPFYLWLKITNCRSRNLRLKALEPKKVSCEYEILSSNLEKCSLILLDCILKDPGYNTFKFLTV